MSAPKTIHDAADAPDLHDLWSEALWGVGLIGSVLLFVAFIAAIFGR